MARVLPAAVLAVLAVAAPAQAATFNGGVQNLDSLSATRTQSHAEDWAAFPNTAPNTPYYAPVTGEIRSVTFKGTVLKPTNPAYASTGYPQGFVFHVVVIRPKSDGTRPIVAATKDLKYPFDRNPDQTTTYTRADWGNLCVKQGDMVGLATSGGFGNSTPQYGSFPDDYFANGYPVQMFADVPGASYSVFKNRAPTDPEGNGGYFMNDNTPTTDVPDQQLLMKYTVGTEHEAIPSCGGLGDAGPGGGGGGGGGGGTTKPPASTASITGPNGSTALIRRNTVKLAVKCDGPNPCKGSLGLSWQHRNYGTAAFSLTSGQRQVLSIALLPAIKPFLRKNKGKATANAITTTPAGKKTRTYLLKKA